MSDRDTEILKTLAWVGLAWLPLTLAGRAATDALELSGWARLLVHGPLLPVFALSARALFR